MAVQITIPVSNIASLITAGYTRIEIWASENDGGTYEEITSSSAAAAFLLSTPASTTFRMGGKLLKVSIDGDPEVSISFSSLITYWTPTQVVNRINEVVVGLATELNTSVLLTSPTTSRNSSLLITYCDADDLGWPAGTSSKGKDTRITLVPGTVLYTYIDSAGTSSLRYKWRFSANGANPVSEFSQRILGSDLPVSTVSLSIATAYFIHPDGRPKKTKVLIGFPSPPTLISGYVVGGHESLSVESDDYGFLQVPLVVGITVRVGIEGTNLIREFVVPDSPTFDLLNTMATADDTFTIQTTPPLLIRRSI